MWVGCESLVKFVLGGAGPVLMRADDHRLQGARRFFERIVYTSDFAMLLWRHAMMNWGRQRETTCTLVKDR